ncbi:(2Fe-2S)-binding protein [Photobacterium japonica]|uniref:(2Fe-2S)-binding protein n=1 Tax=Photobacterium japonica TaxID=2910235 RepID=UPI003D0C5AA8
MNISTDMGPLWPGQPDTSSLHAQLDWLTQCEPFFRLQTGQQGDTLAEWLDNRCSQVIALFCQDIQTQRAVGASMWLKGFSAHLLSGMAALRLKFQRVMHFDVHTINLLLSPKGKVKAVSITDDAPFYCLATDPLAGSPLARVVASEAALDAQFSALLVALGQYMAPYFKIQKVSRTLFWGHWGYAVGLVFQKLTQNGADSVLLETLQPNADRWLQSLLPATATLNAIKVASQAPMAVYYVRRETCCLKYKLDGKKHCSTCQLTDPEEQRRRYQAKLSA